MVAKLPFPLLTQATSLPLPRFDPNFAVANLSHSLAVWDSDLDFAVANLREAQLRHSLAVWDSDLDFAVANLSHPTVAQVSE